MSDVAAATAIAPQVPAHPSAWHSASGFGFRDLIDIVNPLQHLPIIGSIYRWATGDRPGDASRIAGDALYGGPIGVAFGLVGAAMEDSSGHDLGERVLSAMFDSDKKTTAVASATPPAGGAASSRPSVAAPPNSVAPAGTPGTAQASAAAPPAVPDHAPMPLFGGIAHMPPGARSQPQQPQPGQSDDAARDFLAHKASLQREVSGAPGAAVLTRPIPLVTPAGALPPARPSGAPAPVAATVASPPIDVSQKMLDALDKYMKMEKERKTAPGSTDGPAPPGVDLSL